MALNKEKLKLNIYSDLAQTDTVLEEDAESLAERAPSSYEYNVSPFPVEGNSVARIESPDASGRNVLGEVKPGTEKEDVDVSGITVDSDVSTVAATAEIESEVDGPNAAKLLVNQLKQERRATVFADRIIQHLLDNLETEEAGENIQLLREFIQYLTARVLTLNESIGDLAAHTSSLSTNLAGVINNLQTMATTQAASGTFANPAAFTALNAALTTVNTSLTSAGIISESADIQRAKAQVDTDLDSSIGYKADLAEINYENSKSVK